MILRNGAIDDNVFERSVVKRLQNVRNPKGLRPSRAEGPVSFLARHAGFLSVITALNDLAAEGIRPEDIRTSILLPEGSEEALLRSIADEIHDAAAWAEVTVSACCARTCRAVTRPVVWSMARGSRRYFASGDMELFAEDCAEVLMIGRAGLSGTFLLAEEKRGELEQRFPVRMLERAACMKELLLMTPAMEALENCGIRPAFLVSGGDGGVLASLWELAKQTGGGLEAELPAIPLFQETIEITDYYGINPYQLSSAGCMLAVVADAESSSELLAEKGIYSKKIGEFTKGRDKILINGEERQNLNRPEADSLLTILA